jgi:membrane associated rhomboid family serine protease
MFLPLSDSPNPGGRPYVTYALIATNVLVYFAVSLPLSIQAPDPNNPALITYLSYLRNLLPPGVSLYDVLQEISAYNVFVFAHGYKPGAPNIADLFTSLFLHSGFIHLAGNMLFLWIYGDNVEYKLGRLAFLLWYLGTGVVATLVFSIFAHGSMMPLVGASGAISGVLGFYFLWFPRNKVRLFVWLFPFYVGTVSVPSRIVLGVFLVVDNIFPFLLDSASGGGVAYGAHIGGFLAGLVGAFVIERMRPSTDGLDLPEVDDGLASKPRIRQALDDNDLGRPGQ